MSTYYASPTGASGNAGTIGSPWDLQTALNNVSQTSGDTLYLRGGIYLGRFDSTLAGGTVRSYTDEWAAIDGYRTTTLSGALNSSSTTFTIGSSTGIVLGSDIQIDDEILHVTNIAGTTITAVRGWDGTTAVSHLTSTLIWIIGSTLVVHGSNTTYRDFEVYDSNPTRSFATLGDASLRRGQGLYVFGAGTSFINLVIHDCQDGIFKAVSATGVTFYGVLTYNNGHVDPNRGNGHGFYIQNDTGSMLVSNTLSFNNFATGMKGFGETGPAKNITFTNNISFNNGSTANSPGNPAGYVGTTHRFTNLTVGTAVTPPENITVTNNYLYSPSGTLVEESNMRMGYISQGAIGLTVTGNRIMGGNGAFEIIGFNDAVVTGNKFYAEEYLSKLTNGTAGLASYTWNNNDYYDTCPLNSGFRHSFNENNQPNRFGGGNIPYDDPGNGTGKGWKQWTGFDSTSTYTAAAPTVNEIVVLPNSYQAGRAHIAVYNWALSSTVSVSLASAGLSVGQHFDVHNAQDYNGTLILSNQIYTAGMSITVPMTGLSVATPLGSSFTPATVGPEFAAFVIVPLSTVTPPSMQAGTGTKFSGGVSIR